MRLQPGSLLDIGMVVVKILKVKGKVARRFGSVDGLERRAVSKDASPCSAARCRIVSSFLPVPYICV